VTFLIEDADGFPITIQFADNFSGGTIIGTSTASPIGTGFVTFDFQLMNIFAFSGFPYYFIPIVDPNSSAKFVFSQFNASPLLSTNCFTTTCGPILGLDCSKRLAFDVIVTPQDCAAAR